MLNVQCMDDLCFNQLWHSLAPPVPIPWQRLEAMSSSTNKKLPVPVKAGLVKSVPSPPPPPKRRKMSTAQGSEETAQGTAQGSKETWDPEQVTDQPKSKKWWDKGSAGRKKN